MSFRDQRVGTSHSDKGYRVLSNLSPLSKQTYIPFVMKEAMSWVGWRKFNTKKESQSSFGSGSLAQNDYELLRRSFNVDCTDCNVHVWLSYIDSDDMKKVWNGWLQERKHNKYFTDRMKKIDKKCVDEIEKNEHLTGEDYASSILEDMDEFEIRGPFLN